MTPDQLDRIDLRLLTRAYILLDEANVTKAANRAFVTQSAMSRILKRIRELFNDPILISYSSNKMRLTPLGEELKLKLPGVFDSISSVLMMKGEGEKPKESEKEPLSIARILSSLNNNRKYKRADLIHDLMEINKEE